MINDILVRELMNGMWFVLSIEVLIALTFYVVKRAAHEPEPAQNIWIDPEVWYREPGTQMAIAWLTYMAGSAIRAGWIWVLLECQNRIGIQNCGYIIQTVWVLMIASVLAIIGGVCIIRLMMPQRWRPWSYLVPAVMAIIIPVTYHVVV